MTAVTAYQASFDTRYAARYHERCARVWRKLSSLIAFSEIIGGSLALGAWLAQNPQLGAYTGLALAVAAALNHTFKPGDRAAHEERARQVFMGLLAEHIQDLDELNRQLGKLHAEYPDSFEALRVPALNDVAREAGLDERVEKLNFPEKLISLLG